MLTDQALLSHLRDSTGGTRSGLGRALAELSELDAPSPQAINNWETRGLPRSWRYWVGQLALAHIEGFDLEEFMRGEAA